NELLGDIEEVKKRMVFTTHTPEVHGHKIYSIEELSRFFSEERLKILKERDEDLQVHMTRFCLRYSNFSNAVSKKHGEVSREMFPEFKIDNITNGVHVTSWIGDPTKSLY